MKKIIISSVAIISLIAGLMIYSAYADQAFEGKIVNFSSMIAGGSGDVSAEQAEKFAENGLPLAFKSGNKVYFVVNSGGMYNGKSLAKHAGKDITVHGQKINSKGISFILMTKID